MFLTSDKDIGRVCLITRLGGDAEGVQALVLLVEVCECERGSVSAPMHLSPLGWSQELICGRERKDLDIINV